MATHSTRSKSHTPQCCTCHRFVRLKRSNWHIEYGDYGTVHTVEVECERCAAARPYDRMPWEKAA